MGSIKEEESKKATVNIRHYLFVVTSFFCIFYLSFSVLGQSCNYADKGNFMKFSKGCAPIDPEWEIRYAGLALPVKVVVDWGDGTIDKMDALTPDFQETFTHTYPKDEGVCTYRVTAYVEANGVACGETEQKQKITVWDTDNPADGKLSIDPFVFRVCYGNAASINFVDDSQWNCMDPSETATPNDAPRWIQWEYGTGNPLNRIPGVQVNGSTPTYPFKNNPPIYPVTAAGQISDNIYVPATTTIADVGKEFVVTLRNWNQCNPYDVNLADGAFNPINGDLNNGDSAFVYITARVVIVEAPSPGFNTTKNTYGGTPSTKFCPGEKVFFNNSTPHVDDYIYTWSFAPPSGSPAIGNINGRNINTNVFVDPGTYEATLTVRDNNATGTCIATVMHTIEIIKAPLPAMEISVDGGSGTTDLDFCEKVGDSYGFSITNQTTVPTGSIPSYGWQLVRMPTETVMQTLSPAPFNATFDFSLSQPGAYQVRLTATDAATNCFNTVTTNINIYNIPEANFEITDNVELCVGMATTFNDLSDFINPKGFADDEIVSWEWWFDYNGDPTSASDSPDENPTTIFTQARNYDIRLLVESKYGCVDDTIVTITVNPIAKAEITVDDPDDCAPHEPTFTNVHANAQFPVVVERYKWYIYSGGDLVDSLSQYPDAITTFFPDTMAYEFLYTQTDNLDQLYEVYMEAYAAGGCVTTSDTINITVFPTASAKFTSDYNPLGSNCDPVVVNFEVDLATKNLPFSKDYKWSVYDSEGDLILDSGLPDPTAETFTHSFTNPDSIAIENYVVTLEVTSSNGPCLQPYSQQINVNPTPSSKFTVVENRQCEIVTMTFNANQKGLSASNYYWTFIETTTGAPKVTENDPIRDDNFALQFERGASDSTVEVTLRTRNFAGCESSGPSTLYTIPALEQFEVLLDTMAVTPKCSPQEITFYNNSTVPGGTTFELKVQRGSGSPFVVPVADINGDLTDPSFTYTFQESGQYVVTLIGSYVDGCKDEASLNILIHPAVEAIFTPDTTTVCPGQPVYLNEASSPKAIIAQKNWTITNLGDNSIIATRFGSQLFYTFADPGTYEIKLEVISNNGCRDITTHNINVSPRPDFTIQYNNVSCDQIFGFKITANPSSNITEYVWVWGDGKTEISTASEISHTYLNRNGFTGPDQYTGTVTAKASSTTGCEFSRDFTVNLRQQVSASFLMDKDKGCGPLTVVFDDVSLGTDFSNQEWSYREYLPVVGPWTTFDGVSNTFTNTGGVDKTFQVRLVAKNIAGNCSDQITKDVIVYPQITADFSFTDTDKCSPYEVEFTNLSNGLSNPNVTYTWNWGDGSDEVVSSDPNVSHVFLNSSYTIPRNFKVKLTADGSTCSSVIEKTVTVNPAIRASIEPSDTVGCAPLSVEFINDYNGVSSGHSWWVINMNNNQNVDGFENTDPNYYQTFENKTFDTIRYKVMYEGLSAEGCSVSDSAFVLVYPDITPSFTVTPSEQNLPNSTVAISNTTVDNPEYIYHWDFGNGDTSNERNPAPYVYGTYGVFNIILTITDQYNKCPKVLSQMVTINPTIPVIDFEYVPAEGCGPLTVQFTNKSQFVDLKTLVWDFGDNSTSFSNAENPTYTYYEPGEYTVSLKGSNEIGITVTETKNYIINVYDNPRANFRIRQRMPVYIPDSVEFLNESEGGENYHWDFGDGTTSTKFEPKHAYTQPGDYVITLVAINEDGCVDTLRRDGEISIEAAFEVKIPNVFSPNGDDLNDVFLPKMQGVVEYNLMIYNRWGELLYESKNQEIGWDGYYKGILSSPDVYIYKVDLKFTNGERASKFGDVTLLR